MQIEKSRCAGADAQLQSAGGGLNRDGAADDLVDPIVGQSQGYLPVAHAVAAGTIEHRPLVQAEAPEPRRPVRRGLQDAVPAFDRLPAAGHERGHVHSDAAGGLTLRPPGRLALGREVHHQRRLPAPAVPGDDVGRRLLVKPGMTGLWQINGRSDLTWEESVRFDLYYVENWSVAQDLIILWRTLHAVISKDGAY